MFPGSVESVADGEILVRMPARALEARLPDSVPRPATGTQVFYSVRPEKIRLVKADQGRLAGAVEARIFLGNHWVFQIATDLGTVTVVSQNTGEDAVAEGDRVGLDWAAREVRVLQREATA